MHLLGGDQRKTVRQVEAHLMAEDRTRAGAGAVVFFHAGITGKPEQVEILLHQETLKDSDRRFIPGMTLRMARA